MGSRYTLYDDAQLAALIQQRDTYAFRELYNRYFPLLVSFARKATNNDQDAEDIVQEIFITLHQKCERINLDYPIKSYLYVSVRNSLLNFYRNNKRRSEILARFIAYDEKTGYEADHNLREKELARLIEAEIENLPPRTRAIFEMSRKQYLSRKQIAEAQGVSEKTVKKQIQVALNKLRSRLGCFFWLSVMQFILWLNKSF